MSFDPYAAPSEDRGSRNRRGDNSYDAHDEDDYDYEDRGSRGGSRLRPVPLVFTVIFGAVALISLIMTFSVNGTVDVGEAATVKGWIAMAGFVSFGLFIFAVRKVVRKRN